ncbi:fungal chitosanase of glycosyl hydrolase group 75-domain-containing protein [Cladorrhinum sp. PSN259]|nr:fungal chitosanase of glycosyl hydrolase group 75-domain-containing protein [Cladorrhinum sp. PSN259]
MVLLFLAAARNGGANAEEQAAPNNLLGFYHRLRDQTATCKHVLASGFWSTDGGGGTTSYCANDPKSPSVIYLSNNGGKKGGGPGSLANMDVDCDGVLGSFGDDGRCSQARSADYQSTTAFRDIVQSYNVGISDLNTYVHPYVVFGNSGTKKGWKNFDPTKYGVKPLSVMAVVCGSTNKTVFGIWGDTNGDDGEKPMVGEVSISLATECWGKNMSGDYGYDGDDVLYLAFTGDEAVPGPNGADWGAKDFETFERSIRALGEKLVAGMVTEDSKGTRSAVMVAGWVWVLLVVLWVGI